MTVQELMRSYFALGSSIKAVKIVKNVAGHSETVYADTDGYLEQFVKPEVPNAAVRAWGICKKPKHIWISVEGE